MITPPPVSSRRTRYSRSPSGGGNPPSKRSKPSSSNDYGHNSDQARLYTSILCEKYQSKNIRYRFVKRKKYSDFFKFFLLLRNSRIM